MAFIFYKQLVHVLQGDGSHMYNGSFKNTDFKCDYGHPIKSEFDGRWSVWPHILPTTMLEIHTFSCKCVHRRLQTRTVSIANTARRGNPCLFANFRFEMTWAIKLITTFGFLRWWFFFLQIASHRRGGILFSCHVSSKKGRKPKIIKLKLTQEERSTL